MDPESNTTKSPIPSKYLYFVVLIVNLLALCGGISIGWTSPIIPKLTNPNRTDENPIGHVITDSEVSWITAILTLSPLISAYVYGVAADRIGRKWTLTLVGLPILISFTTSAVATSVAVFLVARLFVGIAFGGIATVLFVYIGEISDVQNRGKLLSFYNNFLTFGLLVAYVLGAYLSVMAFNFVIAVIPALFLCLFVIFGVESPVYLLKKDRREEAGVIFRKLRQGTDLSVENELEAWEREVKTSRQGTIRDVLSDRVLIKGLAITIALMVFQQLSGINAVLSYAESIFEDAGSSLPTEISAIIIGFVQFLASFITPIFVDRIGRRILFIFSSTGMIITHTILGAYFYINDNTDIDLDNLSWLPILLLVIFIVVYVSAFGVLPYTVTGEVFPSNVRSAAAATTGSMNALAGFLISLLFKRMQASLGNAGTFWLFDGFCVLALVFVVVVLPETKGKSLEQIHRELRG